MTQFTAIEALGTFHVPEFDIRLDGADPGSRMRFDILDVTYNDDLDALDSFEFSIIDWDPERLETVYSCPWDGSGNVRNYETRAGEKPIPVLMPGVPMSLYMSYRDHTDEPVLMLRGRIVSLSTSFPASGVPVAKVRVLSPLADLAKVTLEGKAVGGALDVMKAITDAAGLTLNTDAVPAQIKAAEQGLDTPETVLSELDATEFVRTTARELGLNVQLEQSESGDILKLGPQLNAALSLIWGRTLLSFAPAISTSGLVPGVTLRKQDILGDSAESQKVDVTKTWDDLTDLNRAALGPGVLDNILADLVGGDGPDVDDEVIDKPTLAQTRNPEQAVLNRLREIAMGIVTGSGQTVGVPSLRKGARIELLGLGGTFSGVWEVTKSTHTMGATGYTTSFQARKEIFNA